MPNKKQQVEPTSVSKPCSNAMLAAALSGNRLIFEFDGWTIEPGMENEENPFYNKGWNMVLLSDAKFHLSWEWLMPIVQKTKDAAHELWEKFEDCEPLHLSIDIWNNEVKFVDTETGWYPFPVYTEKDGTVLENTWKIITDFLLWRNEKLCPKGSS